MCGDIRPCTSLGPKNAVMPTVQPNPLLADTLPSKTGLAPKHRNDWLWIPQSYPHGQAKAEGRKSFPHYEQNQTDTHSAKVLGHARHRGCLSCGSRNDLIIVWIWIKCADTTSEQIESDGVTPPQPVDLPVQQAPYSEDRLCSIVK
jgi:hypothetical protein